MATQAAITDFWKSYSGLLGNDIAAQMGYSSHLLTIMRSRKKQWLEESGFVLNHVLYERPGITADAQAEYVDGDNAAYPEAIKANSTANYDGSSTGGAYNRNNNVDPPTDTVKFNYLERGYGLIQKAFQTDDFSVESLRAAAKSAQQMQAITGLLTRLSREYWIRLHRDELSRIAQYRFVATGSSSNPTFTENSDHYECYDSATAARWNSLGFSSTSYDVAGSIDTPDKQDTSILTLGHLEDIYMRLVEEGVEYWADQFVEGQPLIYLLTDLQTKRRLLTEGSTNGRDVRTDIRESSMADELLKPMGVTTTLNGFVILPEAAPRRFDITGDSGDSSLATGTGVWTERTFYSNSGNTRLVNSSYRSAEFTESYILVPRAVSCFAPRPSYTGVGSAKFLPQNYMGDYSFRVIEDKDLNPDGAHGFFRGKLGSATVAENPYLIYVIRHRKGEGTAVA